MSVASFLSIVPTTDQEKYVGYTIIKTIKALKNSQLPAKDYKAHIALADLATLPPREKSFVDFVFHQSLNHVPKQHPGNHHFVFEVKYGNKYEPLDEFVKNFQRNKVPLPSVVPGQDIANLSPDQIKLEFPVEASTNANPPPAVVKSSHPAPGKSKVSSGGVAEKVSIANADDGQVEEIKRIGAQKDSILNTGKPNAWAKNQLDLSMDASYEKGNVKFANTGKYDDIPKQELRERIHDNSAGVREYLSKQHDKKFLMQKINIAEKVKQEPISSKLKYLKDKKLI